MNKIIEKVLYTLLTPIFLIMGVLQSDIVDWLPKGENENTSKTYKNIIQEDVKDFSITRKEIKEQAPHTPHQELPTGIKGTYLTAMNSSASVINTFNEIITNFTIKR